MRLTISNTGTRKININTASLDELKSHPYIWFNLAKAIISYRNQHGLFTAIEDLKKLIAVTEEVYEKLRNYITVASE